MFNLQTQLNFYNKQPKMIKYSTNSMLGMLKNSKSIFGVNTKSYPMIVSQASISSIKQIYKLNYAMKASFLFSSSKPPKPEQSSSPSPQVQSSLESQRKFSPKHKSQQQAQQYEQNAQISGQDDKKSTGFVPSSFGNYFIGISCLALLLAYALMEVQFMRASNKKKTPADGAKKVIAKGKAHIGGDWELKGTNGQTITNKNFQGSYYLIYFGFCNCPDICPNSLMKLSKAVEKVKKTSQARFFDLKTVFVSVDPDRDTGQKIDKFAKYFDKEIIGVTGTSNDDPALKQCMKKFKIYSSKIQFQDQDSIVKGRKSYTIDHTILTYLINPQNEYVTHIGANLGQYDITKLIMQKIKQDQKSTIQKLKL